MVLKQETVINVTEREEEDHPACFARREGKRGKGGRDTELQRYRVTKVVASRDRTEGRFNLRPSVAILRDQR